MASAVQAPRFVTLERLQKAFSSTYLTRADTNLVGPRPDETAIYVRDVVYAREPSDSSQPGIAARARSGTPSRPPPSTILAEDVSTWSPIPLRTHAASGVRRHTASFGPTWSTHWLHLDIAVPPAWLSSSSPIALVIDPSCEACLYTPTGSVLQGITGGDAGTIRGNRRAVAPLPRDMLSPTGHCSIYVEVACNTLFGAGGGGMIEAPDPDKTFNLETLALVRMDDQAYTLFWDMVALLDLAEKGPTSTRTSDAALAVANAALNVIDRDDAATFAPALALTRAFFSGSSSTGDGVLDVVTAIGHCHIDTAWLWPFAETRRKIVRSWASQLVFMTPPRAGGYRFAASQMVQYEWLRTDAPELFERVKDAVATGSFVPVGGSWTEPDANMPSGEALVRQFLYGVSWLNQHMREPLVAAAVREAALKGVPAPRRIPHAGGIFFLPDTFGYCAQLPQIIRGVGLRYFLTQKLSWSLVNKPQHSTFWWTALDGSNVLVHFPPADNYNAQADVADTLRSASNNKERGRSRHSLMLFGNGDGGGGPNAPMFEQLARLGVPATTLAPSGTLPGMPRVRFAHPTTFFDDLAADCTEHDVTACTGELYLELHAGTLTTHACTKALNRRAEVGLQVAEAFNTMLFVHATAGGDADLLRACNVAHDALAHAWMQVALCQFHDVLPGSSIAPVYDDAAELYTAACASASDIATAALTCMHSGSTPPQHVTYVNACCTPRALLIVHPSTNAAYEVRMAAFSSLCLHQSLQVVHTSPHTADMFDPARAITSSTPSSSGIGAHCPTCCTMDEVETFISRARASALAGAEDDAITPLPAVVVIRWQPKQGEDEPAPLEATSSQRQLRDAALTVQECIIVDNGVLRIIVNQRGQLLSVVDLEAGARESVKLSLNQGPDRSGQHVVGANALHLHSDVPWFWDAWDTFIYRDEKYSVLGDEASTCIIAAAAPHAVRLRVTHPRIGARSALTQDIILLAGARVLEFDTTVEWHEAHKMLRAAFPVTIRAPTATYDTQFGCVQRPTHSNTSRDAMQYEVCGHAWGDLSAPDYGVALLNDCKYGYAARGSVLSLSLLRSPKSPDPAADMGTHRFRYAMLPHAAHVCATDVVLHAAKAFNAELTRVESGVEDAGAASAAAQQLEALVRGDVTCDAMIDISAADGGVFSVVLDTVKRAEQASNAIVLRLYEALGHTADCTITTGFTFAGCEQVNLLEEVEGLEGLAVEEDADNSPVDLLDCAPDRVKAAFARHAGPERADVRSSSSTSLQIRVQPFQIVTLLLTLATGGGGGE